MLNDTEGFVETDSGVPYHVVGDCLVNLKHRIASIVANLDDLQAGLEACTRAVDTLHADTTKLDGVVSAPVRQHKGMIAEAVRRLDDAGVAIDDISLHRPTLDDVFISLTGHAAAVEPSTELPVVEVAS